MDYAPQYRLDPLPRSFAADAHGCIMVRPHAVYRIQCCGAMIAPDGELPSGRRRLAPRQRQNDVTVLAAVKAKPCGWPLKRGQP
jgi:hypothetical protein